MPLLSFRRPPRREATLWAGALAAGACVLAAGCSSGASTAAGAPSGAGAARFPAAHQALSGHAKTAAGASAANGAAGAVPAPAQAAAPPGATQRAGLTSVPLPGGQSVIFTATVSLTAADVQGTVARATQLAEAAGGYVSGEHTTFSHARHVSSTVSIQFKVPAAGYPATLGKLAGLGTLRSETQQAQDVTGQVADVNSRVASAQAAIAQLRTLLTRAGSVGGLLTVQDQINSQEADLEALQSQQRALARETAYSTISLTVTTPAARQTRHHHRPKGVAGFLRGLTAGWRALRAVVSWLLTGAGAVLPFAIPLALLALAGLTGWRRLGRRRARARPAA